MNAYVVLASYEKWTKKKKNCRLRLKLMTQRIKKHKQVNIKDKISDFCKKER